ACLLLVPATPQAALLAFPPVLFNRWTRRRTPGMGAYQSAKSAVEGFKVTIIEPGAPVTYPARRRCRRIRRGCRCLRPMLVPFQLIEPKWRSAKRYTYGPTAHRNPGHK